MDKRILILILFLGLALAKTLESRPFKSHKRDGQFLNFAKRHHRKYRSQEETVYRLSIFKDNADRAERLTQQSHAVFGENQFTDLTQEEFLCLFTGTNPALATDPPIPVSPSIFIQQAISVPESVNLISSEGNSPVRTQGLCGSCWAFSACSSMEYAYWKKYGQTVDLSEQYLVDCVSTTSGCEGGWMPNAFQYIKFNLGLTTEDTYPYTAIYKPCDTTKKLNKVVKLNSSPYETIGSDDLSIKYALYTKGVLSSCIDAKKIMMYVSGVLTDTSMATQSPVCNHGISLVGYGVDNDTGIPYYTVKNSWGTAWGEQGYLRIDSRRFPNGNLYSPLIVTNIYYPNVK